MEADDYLWYDNNDPLLYKWATSILNEVVLWDKLRDEGYIFTQRDREAYNIIKQWNPYLKSLQGNGAISHYIDDVADGNEQEAALISSKFKNSELLDRWIEARLVNMAMPPPSLSAIDEYFFISEHNALLNDNILRLSEKNFSLPTSREPAFPPNWFKSPITGKQGIITILSVFLWLHASRKYLDQRLILSKEDRSMSDNAYTFLLSFSSPYMMNPKKQSAGYFIHFYTKLKHAQDHLKNVLAKGTKLQLRMMLINFDKPRFLDVITGEKSNTAERPIIRFSIKELDFELSSKNNPLLNQIRNNIFVMSDSETPYPKALNTANVYLEVTLDESQTFYKSWWHVRDT